MQLQILDLHSQKFNGAVKLRGGYIRKGKEEYLYSAFIQRLVSKRSDMDHIVLPAKYTMPAFSA